VVTSRARVACGAGAQVLLEAVIDTIDNSRVDYSAEAVGRQRLGSQLLAANASRIEAALFIMLGQATERTVQTRGIVPEDSLFLSPSYDRPPIVPDKVRPAAEATEICKLFFVFESYVACVL
jgi:hypothetical protein